MATKDSYETLAEDPRVSAAVQASHVVMMTAQALKMGVLAEADYDLEVTDQHGNTVKTSGTLRLKSYQIDPGFASGASLKDINEQAERGLRD